MGIGWVGGSGSPKEIFKQNSPSRNSFDGIETEKVDQRTGVEKIFFGW